MTATSISPRIRRIGDTLEHVLGCVNESAERNGVALPKRQYITTGEEIVYDCEEVVVSVTELGVGSPEFEFDPAGCGVPCAPKQITITIAIVRCLKVVNENGTMIPPPKLTEKTLKYVQDGWVLIDALGCIDPDGKTSGTVVYGAPDAGTVATTMIVTMQIGKIRR